MPVFQTPTPVKIDQLDLGAIQNNNLRNQALALGNADAARRENALSVYTQAINSGAGQDEATNALRQAGAPELADRLEYNALNRQSAKAAIAKDMDQFIASRVPLAKDQAGWDQIMGEASARYPGITIPDTIKVYSPELQQALLLGGLNAAQNIAMQRTDNTLKAHGYAPGQDPGTLHTIESMRNAADANQRGWNSDQRSAEENERAKESHPYRIENLKSEIQARQERRKVVMLPDPSDPFGVKKIPGYLDPETNSVIPLGVVQQPGMEGMGGVSNPPQATSSRKLDATTAKQYLQKAGGDANKARAMARQDGWSF